MISIISHGSLSTIDTLHTVNSLDQVYVYGPIFLLTTPEAKSNDRRDTSGQMARVPTVVHATYSRQEIVIKTSMHIKGNFRE